MAPDPRRVEVIRAHQSSSELPDESSLQFPNMAHVLDESSLPTEADDAASACWR